MQTTIHLEPETVKEEQTDTFNWFKHWWPVQFVYNLDEDRPNKIELMGENFAVWKSQSGKWIAMKDMCPHRMAPLSEGRVESDGTLMCSYHGWRFNDCGKCTTIPQADDSKSHDAARNNQRSAAKTFPCKVRGSLLWLWPDASDAAFIDAAASPIAFPDAFCDFFDDKVRQGDRSGFSADLPYDYEVLLENLLDPSHVPFAHHGATPGIRRATGGPLFMRTRDSKYPTSDGAASYRSSTGVEIYMDFLGHTFSMFEFPSNKPGVSDPALLFAGTPIKEGWSRLLAMTLPAGALTGNEQGALIALMAFPFTWIVHLANLSVLSGDNVFLHIQDQHLKSLDGWNPNMYFTPMSSDVMMVRARKWLTTIGGGGPFKAQRAEKAPDHMTRRELLDRFRNHVSQCKVCQRGLRLVNNLATVCKVVNRSLLFVTAALAINLMQQGPLRKWILVATAIGCAVFAFFENYLTEKIIPRFYFVDYIHAEKN